MPATHSSPAVLRCLYVGGAPRYDLWSFYIGDYHNYRVFGRPFPSPVKHYKSGRTFNLDHRELIFVGMNRSHCISMSFSSDGYAVEAYININLAPEEREFGWQWEDLELDIRAERDRFNSWSTIVLDYQEYLAAPITPELRYRAESEVVRMLLAVQKRVVPFDEPELPWCGLEKHLDLRPLMECSPDPYEAFK